MLDGGLAASYEIQSVRSKGSNQLLRYAFCKLICLTFCRSHHIAHAWPQDRSSLEAPLEPRNDLGVHAAVVRFGQRSDLITHSIREANDELISSAARREIFTHSSEIILG